MHLVDKKNVHDGLKQERRSRGPKKGGKPLISEPLLVAVSGRNYRPRGELAPVHPRALLRLRRTTARLLGFGVSAS